MDGDEGRRREGNRVALFVLGPLHCLGIGQRHRLSSLLLQSTVGVP